MREPRGVSGEYSGTAIDSLMVRTDGYISTSNAKFPASISFLT